LRTWVAGDEAGEAGGGGKRRVVATDGGVACEKTVFSDEPRAVARRVAPVLESEREPVEKIRGGLCIRFRVTGDAKERGKQAVCRGEAGKDDMVSGVCRLGEKVGFGVVGGAGHGLKEPKGKELKNDSGQWGGGRSWRGGGWKVGRKKAEKAQK
jgi:hypothetical protein